VGPSLSPVERGFVVSSTGVGKQKYVYIVNHLGEPVWWYPTPFSEVTRARMSYDGKYMYARNLNLARGTAGSLLKVAMDGTGEEVMNLPKSHHDFAVAPNDTVLYDDCDGIFKYPGDASTPLFSVRSAFPTYAGTGGLGDEDCHTNAIQYNHFDKTVTFSDANHNALVSFDYETGTLNWVYGGSTDSDFDGDVTWDRQHGHHMTNSNTIYFFNNGAFPRGTSTVYRARLGDGVATWEFSYRSTINSLTLGDVQELPGGNVLVGYSSSGGVLHEVDPNAVLVRAMSLPFTNSGYIDHRPTLYGQPPR
jgi:hypothetical protein